MSLSNGSAEVLTVLSNVEEMQGSKEEATAVRLRRMRMDDDEATKQMDLFQRFP